VRPQPSDRRAPIYALLDGKSVAGALSIPDSTPVPVTQVEGIATLPGHGIGKLAGRLTSMFLYGEDGAARRFDDYRPQVHDSEVHDADRHGGMDLASLANPRELRVIASGRKSAGASG